MSRERSRAASDECQNALQVFARRAFSIGQAQNNRTPAPFVHTVTPFVHTFERPNVHTCGIGADFRELVRDLFSIYKTRIWMQQLDKVTGKLLDLADLENSD